MACLLRLSQMQRHSRRSIRAPAHMQPTGAQPVQPVEQQQQQPVQPQQQLQSQQQHQSQQRQSEGSDHNPPAAKKQRRLEGARLQEPHNPRSAQPPSAQQQAQQQQRPQQSTGRSGGLLSTAADRLAAPRRRLDVLQELLNSVQRLAGADGQEAQRAVQLVQQAAPGCLKRGMSSDSNRLGAALQPLPAPPLHHLMQKRCSCRWRGTCHLHRRPRLRSRHSSSSIGRKKHSNRPSAAWQRRQCSRPRSAAGCSPSAQLVLALLVLRQRGGSQLTNVLRPPPQQCRTRSKPIPGQQLQRAMPAQQRQPGRPPLQAGLLHLGSSSSSMVCRPSSSKLCSQSSWSLCRM